MFTGGFDFAGARAVNRSDYLTILDLLDALVRKSLPVAEQSSGRTAARHMRARSRPSLLVAVSVVPGYEARRDAARSTRRLGIPVIHHALDAQRILGAIDFRAPLPLRKANRRASDARGRHLEIGAAVAATTTRCCPLGGRPGPPRVASAIG